MMLRLKLHGWGDASTQARVGVSSQFKYSNGSLNLNAAFSKYERELVSRFPSTFKSSNVVVDVNKKAFKPLSIMKPDLSLWSVSKSNKMQR